MKTIYVCLSGLLFLFLLANAATAAPLPLCPADSATVMLTEQWNGGNAGFILETSVGYVTDLAVGNSGATAASISSGIAAIAGWTADTVSRADVNDTWSVGWLNGIPGFDGYTSVFLFSSGSSGSSLNAGLTDGFQGAGISPSGSSPFAVRWFQNDNCVKGGNSAVPVPGAVWLMSSGLVALLALRRQQKGAC